jgi:hypothetical protein
VPDVLPLGGVAELVASAQAVGQGRNITKVEFWANNLLIHTAETVSPDAGLLYAFDWNVLSPGNYDLQARAFDNVGNVGLSAVLNRDTAAIPQVS